MSKLIFYLCLTVLSYLVTTLPGETVDTDKSSGITGKSKKNPDSQFSKKDNYGTRDTSIFRKSINYKDFVRHIFMHLHLLDKEKGNTDSIKKDEIDRKLASYTLLFPGVSINTNLIKKEIAIERHLKKTGDYDVSNGQIKKAYEEYVATLPKGTTPPSFDKVKPVFRSRELFKNEDVIKLSRRINKIKEIERYEKIAAKMEPWPVEEMRLNGRNEDCVAMLVDNDSCLITAGDYNKALFFNTMPKLLNKDTARIFLVKKILRNKYLVQKVRASNLENIENHMHDINHWEESKFLCATMKMGSPVSKEEILWETYKNNYHKLFKGYDKVTLEIIGSSDSLWIDSLSKLITGSIKTDTINKSAEIKKTAGEKNELISTIPWIKSEDSRLPEILIIPTDTLPEEGITPLVRTPFGYFICRVVKVQKINYLTFEEAFNQCVYIATRERYIQMDSLMDIKAFDYYNKNRNNYFTPDTIILRTWLIPPGKTKTDIHSDTATFKPLTMNSLSLPHEIREELTELVKSKKNRNSFYGPIESIYGIWYFKADTIKNGGLQIPFHMVRQAIIDSIAKPYIPRIQIPDSDEALQGAKYETQLAEAYIRQERQKTERLSNEEIHLLIKREIIDISDSDKNWPEHRIADYAREKYREKLHLEREEDINKWMLSININKNKLLD